ncbi:MAG: DUF1080 domain-containing protein [Planctomycetes bacterium]|nr:DUF1080 domain-containing protein [Planctomycetota bacterium]
MARLDRPPRRLRLGLRCLAVAASIGTLGAIGAASFAAAAARAAPQPPQEQQAPGYTDTPLLPDGKWCVHDSRRPQPRVVTPGSASTPAQPGRAPSDAIVLFDGKDLAKWTSGGGEARWKVGDGYVEVNGTGDIETRESFGDCQLHVEWCAPLPASGDSQGRGNSGIYFMQRYEVQVLDCFQNATYPDGQAAALYGQKPPLVNACRAPGEWQSYDIVFEAPRFDGAKLVKPARVTVLHNGVVVHHGQELLGATAHRELARYEAHADRLPIRLQDHGNPVRYRNLWLRPLGEYDRP